MPIFLAQVLKFEELHMLQGATIFFWGSGSIDQDHCTTIRADRAGGISPSIFGMASMWQKTHNYKPGAHGCGPHTVRYMWPPNHTLVGVVPIYTLFLSRPNMPRDILAPINTLIGVDKIRQCMRLRMGVSLHCLHTAFSNPIPKDAFHGGCWVVVCGTKGGVS